MADEALKEVRFVGNMVIAAFFSATKDKARRVARDELLNRYIEAPSKNDHTVGVEEVRNLVTGEFPVTSFHWEIEFPEVFDRENPGFDAIVGNPPYGGKNTLIGGNREGYLEWLKTMHESSHGNADLVAHFFRRAFNILRKDGCFGLIATNTIRQGDTRSTGLRWICGHGGAIYAAQRRYKWPGQAAVVVSVVWVAKGRPFDGLELDGRDVPMITAYLFHAGGNDNPAVLRANEGRSFQGSIILGLGFTFDDTDKDGIANSLARMQELIAKEPRNAERIFPYLGGEEVNEQPRPNHHRFVINFGDLPLRRDDLGNSWFQSSERQQVAWLRAGIVPHDYPHLVAADWPDLLDIVERKVKPERNSQKRDAVRERWWHHCEKRPGLYASIAAESKVIVRSLTSKHHSNFVFATNRPARVFDQTLIVFVFDSYAAFSLLISRVHEAWALFFGATLEDRPRYNVADCFDTFPFPTHFETNQPLEQLGREYYDFRATLMTKNSEGPTKTYNRFHDPNETSPDILRLRQLHAAMDRAVLEAYGWHDLAEKVYCEFLLDYEDEEDNEDDGRARRRKKPWRYRRPDDIRDEVLARLLALNAERAEEERLAGLVDSSPKRSKQRSKKRPAPSGELLFDKT